MLKDFKKNIINMYGSKGHDWLSSLPYNLRDLVSKWQITTLNPFGNLTYNYVAKGKQKKNDIVLKVSINKVSNEIKALKILEAAGAVKIIDHTDYAILMEKANPGKSLKSYFPRNDISATEIFCDKIEEIRDLSLDSLDTEGFPHVSDWLSKLDNSYEDIPESHLAEARKQRDALLASLGPDKFLHGDLHHDNILSHKDDWIFIDPKGVLGEIEYEIGTYLRNPIPGLSNAENSDEIMAIRIDIISERLGLDPERLASWTYVQSILSWIWAIEDNQFCIIPD